MKLWDETPTAVIRHCPTKKKKPKKYEKLQFNLKKLCEEYKDKQRDLSNCLIAIFHTIRLTLYIYVLYFRNIDAKHYKICI